MNRAIRILSLCTALCVAACGASGDGVDRPDAAPDASDASDGTAPADASASDADGAADPCGPGAHSTDSGCASSLRWSAAAPFAQGLDHHVTFVHASARGPALYVVGGAQQQNHMFRRVYATARMAPIATDGTLGEWTAVTSLPDGRFGHGVAVVGDHVYVTAGVTATGGSFAVSATTLWTTVQPDGSLATWQPGTMLPSGRYHHVTVVSGNEVYAIGGRDSVSAATETAEVAHSTVQADGSLGPWSTTTPLPAPLAFHSAVVDHGAIYVTGGLANNQVAPVLTVQRSVIAADGSLGPWTVVGMLDTPAGAHSSLARDGRLYLFGGFADGDAPVATVRRAALGTDGMLGPWEEVADPLPAGRMHVHQRPVYQRWIYSVGGTDETESSTTDVAVGEFY